jgi:hypothetical protein
LNSSFYDCDSDIIGDVPKKLAFKSGSITAITGGLFRPIIDTEQAVSIGVKREEKITPAERLGVEES